MLPPPRSLPRKAPRNWPPHTLAHRVTHHHQAKAGLHFSFGALAVASHFEFCLWAIYDPIPRQRCPDISEAQRLLAWRPTVTLEKGLKSTITYFERLLSEGLVERSVTV